MKRDQIAAFATLVIILVAAAPGMLFAKGQTQTAPAESIVQFADRAEQQVKNLIDIIEANETATAKIEEFGLYDEFLANIDLFIEGSGYLVEAHAALELEETDYETVISYATEALKTFREVYRSIHEILNEAGLHKGQLLDNQGIIEAVTRELLRIDRIREILPEDAPETVVQLLDDAEAYLNEARELILDGNAEEAILAYRDARQLLPQVYQYLKEQAEESNAWRVNGYCDGLKQRIRERFRYGTEQGVDFTAAIESMGYQSESQFMESLENRIQSAKGKIGEFESVIQDLESIGQMVQQMDQALEQEMNRHQNRFGTGSGDSEGGMGNTGSGYGYGGSGAGYGAGQP